MKKSIWKPWKCVKRCVTLIEMMIVMFLIALITGVVAYNYTGTLEKGKAFKTKAGIEKLHVALSLILAENPDEDIENWRELIKTSPLIRNPDELIMDGWGKVYNVSYVNNELRVISTSPQYNDSQQHGKSLFSK